MEEDQIAPLYAARGDRVPLTPGLGSALITLIEPRTGREREYNRWYEDDHYFTAMTAPGVFAGRRWIATTELQRLRISSGVPLAEPLASGVFLGTYWIAPDQLADLFDWNGGAVPRLNAAGRMYYERDLVFTSYQDRVGSIARDTAVPSEAMSLADAPSGIVLEIIDAPDPVERPNLAEWLLAEHLPSRLGPESPATRAILFRPATAGPRARPELAAAMERAGNFGRRLTLIWFLDHSPTDCWEFFRQEPASIRGVGIPLLAPFIPAAMGTDRYIEAIR